MRQEEFNFLSADGHTTIHGVEWTPDGKTRAIIIILHGVTENIMRYEKFAQYFTEKGWSLSGKIRESFWQEADGLRKDAE